MTENKERVVTLVYEKKYNRALARLSYLKHLSSVKEQSYKELFAEVNEEHPVSKASSIEMVAEFLIDGSKNYSYENWEEYANDAMELAANLIEVGANLSGWDNLAEDLVKVAQEEENESLENAARAVLQSTGDLTIELSDLLNKAQRLSVSIQIQENRRQIKKVTEEN